MQISGADLILKHLRTYIRVLSRINFLKGNFSISQFMSAAQDMPIVLYGHTWYSNVYKNTCSAVM